MTKEYCLKCGTELINSAQVGTYCPNKKCEVLDDLYEPKIESYDKYIWNSINPFNTHKIFCHYTP